MPKIAKKPHKRGVFRLLFDIVWRVLAAPLNLLMIAFRPVWTGWRRRIIFVTALAGLAALVIFQFAPLAPMADMVRHQVYAATASMGFNVNDITVEGRRRTRREDLWHGVNVTVGKPIFAIDLHTTRMRVEALPWVREAVIIRQLPNVLHITLVERKAFALYQDGQSLSVIDKLGDPITSHHLNDFAHLPVFSGKGATLRAAGLVDLLYDYPVLHNRMTAAHWMGGRRWILRLNHGGEVHLPERDLAGALDRLMALEQQKRVLAIENQAIDLRLPDRVLLRPQKSSRLSPASPAEERS